MELTVQFPDPNQASDEGLVAVGGELSSNFLLSAYAQGVFPWFSEGDPIMWFCPNPRMVLYPQNYRLKKSLKQLINKQKYELRIDSDFKSVIVNCATTSRDGQDGTWITDDMINAYIQLHELGYAHSFETYENNVLVGGLYGVSLGKAFFGESMFYKKTDASKFALYYLVEFVKRNKFNFIDAQQSTQHMESMGGIEIPRERFLQELDNALLSETITDNWKDK